MHPMKCVRSSSLLHPVMLKTLPWWWIVPPVRSVTAAQRPIIAADAWCCQATDQTRPVLIRAASGHLCRARFFMILHPAWFPSSCLYCAWYLGSSLVLLGSFLWCWSWDHHVAFVQVTSCTLLNYKTITCKFISPIWLCWSLNTKIQSKWA